MAKNPVKGVSSFFYFEPFETVNIIAPIMCRESFFRLAIHGNAFPSSISLLGQCGNMPLGLDLEKAMLWSTLDLCQNSSILTDIIEKKEKYDQAFLLGNYSECKKMLDEIISKHGQSLWSIRGRISLLSKSVGFEAQKKYTKDILNELQENSISYYIINSYSQQCEDKVSFPAFISKTRRDYSRFIENHSEEIVCLFSRYIINGFFQDHRGIVKCFQPNILASFLAFNNRFSLIDRYIFIKQLINNIFSFEGNDIQIIRARLLPFIKKLANSFDDPFWNNIICSHIEQHLPIFENTLSKVLHTFDLYTKGYYKDCFEYTSKLLINSVDYFPLIEIYVKSAIELNQESPNITTGASKLNDVIHALVKLLNMTGDIWETQFDLYKILYTQLDTTWANELLLLIDKIGAWSHSMDTTLIPDFYSKITLPSHINEIYNKTNDTYLLQKFESSLSVQFSIATGENDIDKITELENIEPIRKTKYIAIALSRQNPKQSIELVQSIPIESVSRPTKYELNSMLIENYLYANDTLSAAKVFVDSYFDNKNFIYCWKGEAIFEEIKKDNFELSRSIISCIFCKIYLDNAKQRNSKDDIILCVCYEDYLSSQNVSVPSELFRKLSGEDDTVVYLQYFLSEICVPQVMDHSLVFPTYDDVLRERIVICNELVRLYPAMKDRYVKEIQSLTNRLLENSVTREIEHGKIYADIDGIRKTIAKQTYEQFERYQQYRQLDIDEVYVQYLNSSTKNDASIRFLSLAQDTMLEEIIKKARDIYVSDSKYGLDGYLSVRIRHGTLESQLRSCFERLHLVTSKDVSGQYQNNTHWEKKGVAIPSEVRQEIFNIFSNYSKEVDGIISFVKKELIQIKTEENVTKGLFEFDIDPFDIGYIKSYININSPYEEFENAIINYLLGRTDISLETVQRVLRTKIMSSFIDAINNLQGHIEDYKEYICYQHLKDSLAAARTNINNAILSITRWFTFKQPDSFQDYDVNLAAHISGKIMQGFDSSFSYEFVETEKIKLKGTSLVSMVEIFKILFDNVIKHSGDIEKKVAALSVKRADNTITVIVRNKVKAYNINEKALKTIVSDIDNWEKNDAVFREGGSGFYKIKKILSVDLRSTNNIDISFNDNIFEIRIEFDLGDYIV